ncbi:perforin PLP1, putative [Babesia ovis]|uniref:Perforin PLP1, putative n=1 Tax=Babesia ovis TaxID=5869 RepID=A0A9W5TB68_BABOV|nr:perforin PLP1, putative [Babesia ovis]
MKLLYASVFAVFSVVLSPSSIYVVGRPQGDDEYGSYSYGTDMPVSHAYDKLSDPSNEDNGYDYGVSVESNQRAIYIDDDHEDDVVHHDTTSDDEDEQTNYNFEGEQSSNSNNQGEQTNYDNYPNQQPNYDSYQDQQTNYNSYQDRQPGTYGRYQDQQPNYDNDEDKQRTYDNYEDQPQDYDRYKENNYQNDYQTTGDKENQYGSSYLELYSRDEESSPIRHPGKTEAASSNAKRSSGVRNGVKSSVMKGRPNAVKSTTSQKSIRPLKSGSGSENGLKSGSSKKLGSRWGSRSKKSSGGDSEDNEDNIVEEESDDEEEDDTETKPKSKRKTSSSRRKADDEDEEEMEEESPSRKRRQVGSKSHDADSKITNDDFDEAMRLLEKENQKYKQALSELGDDEEEEDQDIMDLDENDDENQMGKSPRDEERRRKRKSDKDAIKAFRKNRPYAQRHSRNNQQTSKDNANLLELSATKFGNNIWDMQRHGYQGRLQKPYEIHFLPVNTPMGYSDVRQSISAMDNAINQQIMVDDNFLQISSRVDSGTHQSNKSAGSKDKGKKKKGVFRKVMKKTGKGFKKVGSGIGNAVDGIGDAIGDIDIDGDKKFDINIDLRTRRKEQRENTKERDDEPTFPKAEKAVEPVLDDTKLGGNQLDEQNPMAIQDDGSIQDQAASPIGIADNGPNAMDTQSGFVDDMTGMQSGGDHGGDMPMDMNDTTTDPDYQQASMEDSVNDPSAMYDSTEGASFSDAGNPAMGLDEDHQMPDSRKSDRNHRGGNKKHNKPRKQKMRHIESNDEQQTEGTSSDYGATGDDGGVHVDQATNDQYEQTNGDDQPVDGSMGQGIGTDEEGIDHMDYSDGGDHEETNGEEYLRHPSTYDVDDSEENSDYDNDQENNNQYDETNEDQNASYSTEDDSGSQMDPAYNQYDETDGDQNVAYSTEDDSGSQMDPAYNQYDETDGDQNPSNSNNDTSYDKSQRQESYTHSNIDHSEIEPPSEDEYTNASDDETNREDVQHDNHEDKEQSMEIDDAEQVNPTNYDDGIREDPKLHQRNKKEKTNHVRERYKKLEREDRENEETPHYRKRHNQQRDDNEYDIDVGNDSSVRTIDDTDDIDGDSEQPDDHDINREPNDDYEEDQHVSSWSKYDDDEEEDRRSNDDSEDEQDEERRGKYDSYERDVADVGDLSSSNSSDSPEDSTHRAIMQFDDYDDDQIVEEDGDIGYVTDHFESPSGLEYLGAGYDLIKGNPLGDTISLLDPGYRANIIQMHWRDDDESVSNSRHYIQPKGAWIRPYISCHKGETVSELAKEKSMENALSVDAEVSTAFPGDTVKFAASLNYNNMKKAQESKGLNTYVARSYCFNYVAGIPMSIRWDFTEAFDIAMRTLPKSFEQHQDGYRCLPSEYRNNPRSQGCKKLGVAAWMKLFTIFGTHVTTKVYLGGKMQTIIETNASQEADLAKQGFDVKAELSIQAKAAMVDTSVSASVSKNMTKDKNSLDSKRSQFVIGGDIYGDGHSLQFNEWAETVENYSMPIKAEYTPLAIFMGPDYLKAYSDAYVYYGKVLLGNVKKQ